MPEMSRVLKNTVVTAQFAGGLRIYSIQDPQEPKEIAYFAPNVPGNKAGAIQMNDLIVGKDDLIYANDRFTGGLYILKCNSAGSSAILRPSVRTHAISSAKRPPMSIPTRAVMSAIVKRSQATNSCPFSS